MTDFLVTHGPAPTAVCPVCRMVTRLPAGRDGSVPVEVLAWLEHAHRHGEPVYGWGPSPAWPPREGR